VSRKHSPSLTLKCKVVQARDFRITFVFPVIHVESLTTPYRPTSPLPITSSAKTPNRIALALNCFGSHSVYCSKELSSPGKKRSGPEAHHTHLASRLRTSEAVAPFPLYYSTACTWSKRENAPHIYRYEISARYIKFITHLTTRGD
jgi:hypothetical protein